MIRVVRLTFAKHFANLVAAPPRFVDMPPPPGCIAARLDTHAGILSLQIGGPLAHIWLSGECESADDAPPAEAAP